MRYTRQRNGIENPVDKATNFLDRDDCTLILGADRYNQEKVSIYFSTATKIECNQKDKK